MSSRLSSFLFILFLTGISFTNFGQNSFEILLEVEGGTVGTIDDLIEVSNGNFVGRYTQFQYSDTLKIRNDYIIQISPIGDTATYLFQKEDTVISFLKFFQVNDSPIQYFVSALCVPIADDELFNDMFMLLDENFNIIWEKQYTLSDYELYYSFGNILRLTDGSFIYARQPNAYIDNMYVFHLSADGDSLNFRLYEGDSAGRVLAVTYSPDSSAYWLHVYSANYDPTKPRAQVLVLDKQLEYTKLMYYPRWFGQDYYAKILPDKRVVASGSYNDGDYDYMSTYIVDTGLNVLYEDYVTDPDTPFAATGTCVDYYYPDQIYTGGTHNRSYTGHFPAWFVLAKYNEELDLIYERYIGDSANYWLFNVTATSDSGVLLSGNRFDYWEPVPRRKAIVMKLNPDGLIVGSEEVPASIKISKAIVYPNPGTAKMMVRTALKNCIIRLFDMKGTEVMAELIDKHITEINTRNLKPGTYIFVIEQNNTAIETGKWIKQ